MTVVTDKPIPLRRGEAYWLDVRPDYWGTRPSPGKLYPYDSVTAAQRVLGRAGLEYFKRKQNFDIWCSDPEKFSTFEKIEAEARDRLDSAADRGATIHSLAESLDAGGEIDLEAVPERFRGYARALVTFERDLKPLTLHTEATVFNTVYGYAGTLDRICEIGGRTVLVDRKTSKQVYIDHAIQVRAYRDCDVMLTKDFPPQRMDMPRVEATCILLLGEDGTYTFREVSVPPEAFLHVLWLYRFTKEAKF